MAPEAFHRETPLHGAWELLAGIALVSFGLLAHEVTLSRLLSALLSYHFSFAVLSSAVLGLGLGGLILHLLGQNAPEQGKGLGRLIQLGLGTSLALPISALLIVWISRIPGLGGEVLWYIAPSMVPFLLGGAFLAEVYRCFPGLSSRTYGADLMGAAAGAPGAILLLDALGAARAPMLLGILCAVGVLFLGMLEAKDKTKRHPWGPALGCLSLCTCLALAHWLGFLPLELSLKANRGKEIHEAISTFKGRIQETIWSSFGRTDLVAYEGDTSRMDIYLDGTAGSPMYRFDGQVSNEQPWLRSLQEEFPGYLPLALLEEKDNALVIGPGGGRDVLLALLAGVRSIEAVEINGDLVKMVRDKSWFNGGIYNDFPNVSLHVAEGRSYLWEVQKRYDIIFLSLPVTNTSRSIEGYSLTENFLFTVESMGEYWDHLAEEGRLVVVAHNDAELLRLISISLFALAQKGMDAPSVMKRIWVLSSGDYLALVLSRRPFDASESQRIYSAMAKAGYTLGESYVPLLPSPAGLNPALVALGTGRLSMEELVEMVWQKGYDVRAVSDESPFFYRLEAGVPGSVLGVLGAALGVLVTTCLLFWGWVHKGALLAYGGNGRRATPGFGPARAILLFSMLGLGFMLVEISFVQRFTLLLGQPVWTMGTVIFSLLVSAGAGSLLAGRWNWAPLNRRIATSCLIVGLGILAYAGALKILAHTVQAWPTGARVVVILIATAPLGFFMGIPFPLGVRLVSQEQLPSAIPWMWAFNGIGSVIGSSLTILLALELGFTAALLAAALCYFLVSAALFKA